MICEVVICILICILVHCLVRYVYFKPIEIKYKISFKEWIFPNTGILFAVLFCMFTEMKMCMSLDLSVTGVRWIIDEFLRAGALIVGIVCGSRIVYDRALSLQRLDKLAMCNETTKKLFITSISLLGCVLIGIVVFPYWNTDGQKDLQPFVSRIIAWIINIIGIWIDFGKGNDKTEGLFKRMKERVIEIRKNTELYAGYILTILIPAVFLVIYAFNPRLEIYFGKLAFLIVLMIAVAFITEVILDGVFFPKVSVSEKRLKKKLGNISNDNSRFKTGHYKGMTYLLLKDKEELQVIVIEEKVIWNGHETIDRELLDNIFGNLFAKYSLELGVEGLYEEIKEYLNHILEKRDAAVDAALEKAKKHWQEENIIG